MSRRVRSYSRDIVAPSDGLTSFPRALRASTEQPKVIYRRVPGLIAIHGRIAVPREVVAVSSFEDPPIVVCRLARGAMPRALREVTVSAVYALTPRGEPAVPTGRVLVRFAEGIVAAERGDLFAREGFALLEPLPYAPSAAWVRAASGGIPASLAGIPALEALPGVVNVEPQLLRRAAHR